MTSGASYVSRLVGQGVRVSLPTLLAWQDQRGHVPKSSRAQIRQRHRSIWNMALPAGVVVSSPCWCRNRSMRSACSSDPTRSWRLRPAARRGLSESEGQRRTLARQMKRWRASLNPSRSPGTVGEKARCTERCAGCSCARGSAAGCAYRRPGWPTLAAGAWPKPATWWLGNCA